MKSKPSLRSFLAVSGSALLVASQAHAAIYYWDTTTTGTWATTANWSNNATTGGTTGTVPTSADTAWFNQSSVNGAEIIQLSADQSIAGIVFANTGTTLVDSDSTTPRTLTVGSGGLTLNSGAGAVTLGNAINVMNLSLGTSQTWINNSSNALTVVNGVSLANAGSQTLTLAGSGGYAFSGVIDNGSGTLSLTKAGTGTTTLTGANTYTGITTISGGTLQIGNGTTGSLIGADTAATFDGALTFSGTGTFNVREAAGSTQRMGALTLSAGDASITSTAAGVSSAATLTFASLAARTAGATANFTLATNTTSTGATPNKIVLSSTTNAPLNSGSNNPGLFFGGTEYARYDAAGYFRAVTYGTDTNASVTSGGSQAASAIGITVTTGAAADVKLTGAITNQNSVTLNTLNMAGQNLTLTNTSQILSVNGILSTGGTISTAGLLQAASAGGEMVLNVASNTLVVNPIIQNNTSASSLTKSGAGTLQFNGINTYSGTTTINSGTVDVRAGTAGGSAVWGTGPITLSQGATLFLNPTNQAIQNTSGFSVTGAITLSGGAGTTNMKFAGNDNKFVLSGGVTGQAGVAQTLAISQGVFNTNGDRMTTQFTSAIADGVGGTLGVSVNFAGATTTAQRSYTNFSGQNTFTSNLTITNTQGLNGTGTNPGAWVTIGGLRHDGFSAPTVVSVGTGFLGAGADYSGNISISNGTGGLTTLGFLTSANQILRGGISGTGSLHQGGTGSLTLNAANTFSGTTTVAGGKIILGNALALQNSPYVTTGSNGSTIGIDLTGYTTPTLGGLSGAVNLASAFTGGYSSVSNLTLNPQAGSSVTYSGNIANGAMILTKTGAGTQVLSGTNTYAGGTNLSLGMLQFGKLVSQPATGAVAVTGGSLAVNLGGIGEWTTGTSGTGTIGGLLAGLGGQSGGTVSYSDNVALGFDTTNGFANPNGIATQTFSGAIANVGTTLGITKLGTNILILAGNNTYTGATTVNAGRLVLTGTNSYTGGSFINGGMLQFGKLTAQPASSAVTVGTGGTLAVNLGGVGEWTTGTSGNGTIGGLLAGLGGQSGGTVTYSGNVALGFDTSNAPSSQTYSNAIGTVGTTLGVTKLGTGTLVLSGVNSYSGATTVNGGTLLLDKTGTSGTAALASTSALVLGGGNFQMLGKTTGTTTQTLGALTLTANTNNTITLDSNGGTGTTLTLANSGPTRGVGSSLLIDRNIANTTLTTTFGLTAAAQTTTQGILGYALVKDATGIGFATNVSGSIVRYTGADSTFAAATNSGTTNFKATPGGTSTTGAPYLSGSVANPSFNSLHIDTASATGANFLSLNGTVTLTQRALLMTGNNNFTIQSGTLGSSNSEVIVHQAGTGILTISSLISSGTGSLTKDGTGTLIVTNASNAYSGSTTLNAGTLQYASKTAFGTSTLYLAGGTKLQKITEEGNSASLAMSNNIILTGGQVELNVDFSNAKDQWFTGVISGLGSLRVTGSGTFGRALHLAGNNTFTGGVTLDTSTSASAWIALGNANALGTGTLTINHTGGVANQGLGAITNLTSGSGVANNIVINSSATLNLGGPSPSGIGNLLLSGIISGAGSLNKSDAPAKTFILSGTNTYAGSTSVSTGILQLGNGGTTGSLSGTSGITNNANLTINRSNAFTQATDLNNKAINGTGGSLTQAGAGTTTLSLANGYTGGTTVTAGTLLVNNTTGSGTGSAAVSVTGGKLGGTGIISGGVTIGAAGTLAPTAQASGNMLTLGSTVAFTSGSIFEWDLNASTAGGSDPGALADQGDFGQVAAAGLASGTSVFKVVLGGTDSFSDAFWNSNKSWNNIFTATGLSNLATVFSSYSATGGLDAAGIVSGEGYFTLSGTTALNLTWTAVPEPTSALAGLLITACLLRRRRTARTISGS